MSVNYDIQADVIDITSDTPQQTDNFFVDSNVWYWLTYSNASYSAIPYQIREYPAYIQQAIRTKSSLFRCGLSLAELAHIIEKTERDIFNNPTQRAKPKEFRHNYPAERTNVVQEIQIAWATVKELATPVEILINKECTDSVASKFDSCKVDGYDLFMLEAIHNVGITQVLTDDGDFVTFPGIQVFTCNRNIIQSARSQNKLIHR